MTVRNPVSLMIACGLTLTLLVTGCGKKETAKTPAGQGPQTAAAPATPAAKPATPAAKPATPAAKPATPAAKPATPAAKPATPAAKPATPAAKPAAKPAEPAAKPAEPAAKPAEPKEDPAARARKEMEARRKRIQEIYALGRSKEEKDKIALRAIIVGQGPVYERASAIRALGRDKRDGVVPDLKKLVKDKATAVKIEASIKLYQWGEHKFALPVLKGLREQGVALRRAFQTGYDKGKPTYDGNALKFFQEGVKSENVYVRLDSAVGLIELDKAKTGLPVVKKVLEAEEKYHIRMAAVNYLTPLKTKPAVKALLELALKDKDERVAKRARDVLGIQPQAKPAPAPQKDTPPGPAPEKANGK